MSNMMDEKFLRKLLANIKCSVCGQHYTPTHVNVLGHKEELWFLSVYCPSCKSQGLIAAVVKESKTVELVTELSEAEFSKFSAAPPIGSDDILEIHTFLNKFSGDFSSLFAQE